MTGAVLALLGLLALEQRPFLAGDLPRDGGALEFVDRNGLLLGTVLGRDERHTMPVPLANIAPAFAEAVVAAEDRRFFEHGTLDEAAAARALAAALTERHVPRGASTLAMQLGRLLEPVDASPAGKLREILFANRLEFGMSKDAILEAYADRAPMGSNVYGVEAAARTYFGTHADELDLAQAAALAALPNDPVRLDPYRHPAALEARRRIVLSRMRACGFIGAAEERAAARERLALVPRRLGIVAAPHLLFALAPGVTAERARVRTTIDRPLQTFVEAQLRAVVAGLGIHDVRDAAAIVIETAPRKSSRTPGRRITSTMRTSGATTESSAPPTRLGPQAVSVRAALERRAIRPTTILPTYRSRTPCPTHACTARTITPRALPARSAFASPWPIRSTCRRCACSSASACSRFSIAFTNWAFGGSISPRRSTGWA